MSEASVIHDIGYQRYDGPRLGRRHVFGALYMHGLRAAFGFGRSAKAKIFPWLVVGVIAAGRGDPGRGPGADRHHRDELHRSSPTR